MTFIQATPAQLRTIFTRAVPFELLPESKLILAVLYQAIYDGMYSMKESRTFFSTPRCKNMCALIGLDHTFVREMIRKHAWKHFTSPFLPRPNDKAILQLDKERQNGNEKG